MSFLNNNACIKMQPDSTPQKTEFRTLLNNIGYYKINPATQKKTLVGMIMVRRKQGSIELPLPPREARYNDQVTGNIYPSVNVYQEPTIIKVHNAKRESSFHCIKPLDEEVDIIFANPSYYYANTITVLNSTNNFDFKWNDATIDGQVMKTSAAQVNPGCYSVFPIGGKDCPYGLTDEGLKVKDRYIAFSVKSHEPERDQEHCKFVWEPVDSFTMEEYNVKKMEHLNKRVVKNMCKKLAHRNIRSDKMGELVVIKFDRGTNDFSSVTPDFIREDLARHFAREKIKAQQALTNMNKENKEAYEEILSKKLQRLNVEHKSSDSKYLLFPCGHYHNSRSILLEEGKIVHELSDKTVENKCMKEIGILLCEICESQVLGYTMLNQEEEEKVDNIKSDKMNEVGGFTREITTSEWMNIQFGEDTYTKFIIICKGKYITSWAVEGDKVSTEVTKITKKEAAILKENQFLVKTRVNKVITVTQGVTEEEFKTCLVAKDFSSIVVNNHDLDVFKTMAERQFVLAQDITCKYIQDFSAKDGFSKLDVMTVYLPIYMDTSIEEEEENAVNLITRGKDDVDDYKLFQKVKMDKQLSISGSTALTSSVKGDKNKKSKIIGISCDFIAFNQFVKPGSKINIDLDSKHQE